jgi:RraA family protein
MNRLHGTKSLRPYHRSGRLVGTAVTIKTRPGDNQALHRAYEYLRPGDVLVVDGAGDLNQALVGEIMMSRARAMGVAGFVIDGAIRDVDAFIQSDFPCYARGVTHRGPYKSGPGEINVPVAVDGMVVVPGDVILGDADGLIAFDRADAAELLTLVRQQEEREANALAAIAEGRVDTFYMGAEKVTS